MSCSCVNPVIDHVVDKASRHVYHVYPLHSMQPTWVHQSALAAEFHCSLQQTPFLDPMASLLQSELHRGHYGAGAGTTGSGSPPAGFWKGVCWLSCNDVPSGQQPAIWQHPSPCLCPRLPCPLQQSTHQPGTDPPLGKEAAGVRSHGNRRSSTVEGRTEVEKRA